ncbi:uncharacterized protein LOC141630753 [Silene latifolia]|uniref:uncharacterized protein LOC141630753 n=1 Tax=Silene latifolia TaxID=37657 RepID=UPI003D7751E8
MAGEDGTNTKLKVIPMSSPLYHHQSDNPNLSLTQIIFNGENYDLWPVAVKNGLDAKNKLGFVKGKVKKPSGDKGDDSLESVAWRQCNAMLKAWYSIDNAPRVHQLKGELNECKQGRESVVEYYTQVKTIWDEFANYSKIPNCTCGTPVMIAKEQEEEKVHQFLIGLDTGLYGQIRTNLLMEDLITCLTPAYALILHEERHSSITKTKEENNEAAMATRSYVAGRGRGYYSKQDTEDEELEEEEEEEEVAPPHCTYCGKYYHTEDSCYDKHGYDVTKSRERGRGHRG